MHLWGFNQLKIEADKIIICGFSAGLVPESFNLKLDGVKVVDRILHDTNNTQIFPLERSSEEPDFSREPLKVCELVEYNLQTTPIFHPQGKKTGKRGETKSLDLMSWLEMTESVFSDAKLTGAPPWRSMKIFQWLEQGTEREYFSYDTVNDRMRTVANNRFHQTIKTFF